MVNPQFTDYIIPPAADAPEMEIHLLENPYSRGPFGAKGVGEIPLNGPAPAAAAAVHRSEEHTSALPSHRELVCRLLLEKKK